MAQRAALVGATHHALESDAIIFTFIGRGRQVHDWIFGGKVSGQRWIFRNPAFVAARGVLRRFCDRAEVLWQ